MLYRIYNVCLYIYIVCSIQHGGEYCKVLVIRMYVKIRKSKEKFISIHVQLLN